MNPRVKMVKPNPDYTITCVFTNGEVKRFDVRPYLNIGVFQELKNLRVFNLVKLFLGSVQWEHGQVFVLTHFTWMVFPKQIQMT